MPGTGENNHGPASFWAVDLHVHTPASLDVQQQLSKYGATTPAEVVAAAVAAGLDAIAVTDHNTAQWCDLVREAAAGEKLVVLPGVEVSTCEGHLLGIWEESTPSSTIEDLLASIGITHDKRSQLDICARSGFFETARAIVNAGGIAIAAHVDREKGLFKQPVKAYINDFLRDPVLAAVEVADLATSAEVRQRTGRQRDLACVRSSDVTLPGQSTHTLAGIGSRRTWIKASRPDLAGLRHALADAPLRVRLEQPEEAKHPVIRSVRVTGGFLDGHPFDFSPDLNCLLGGTGAGKSLLIEIIRFALDQQTNGSDFPSVREEVDSRLAKALGDNATVEVVVQRGQATYTVRRVYVSGSAPAPEVVGAKGEATTLDDGLIPVRAFSQGEVIEYARKPVARMQLIDDVLDLADLDADRSQVLDGLHRNSTEISQLRQEITDVERQLSDLPDTTRKLEELAKFFSDDIVQQQARWSREKARLGKLDKVQDLMEPPQVGKPTAFRHTADNETNQDLCDRASSAYEQLHRSIDDANSMISNAYQKAKVELGSAATEWRRRHADFDIRFNTLLLKIDGEGKGLAVLKKRLAELQSIKTTLDDAAVRLDEQLQPALEQARATREELLTDLVRTRRERRERRKARIDDLNRQMSGVVRIKLRDEADHSEYRRRLLALAKRSGIRTDFLRDLAETANPIKLVRSYLDGDPGEPAKALDLEEKNVERLFDWITEDNRVLDLLDLQTIERPDTLSVEFRKSEAGYEPIEQLAHGQKCTAILIIAMADGTNPLIVDQPEDALHAPWIEEHLVDRLRALRGSRQYIFATRSPGLVISADAEMITTLTADSTRGRVEASGSLERYDMNALALYHLEGGASPFKRRTMKLAPSVD